MESMKIIMWRYKYLLEIAKYRAQNCLIVYLDATWYDSHDTVKEVLTDSSKGSHLSAPVSEGKKKICPAGSDEGFVDNALLFCGKVISKCSVDYHQNMDDKSSKDGLAVS